MSPLRWVGLGLALAGAALAVFLWFSYVGSEKKLAAADERLSQDTVAFQAIARVDRNTALVLSQRQARQASQTIVYKKQKDVLHDAIAKAPDWSNERLPAGIADGLR